jgi:predicted RNA-binding Zn ribbon-like protein
MNEAAFIEQCEGKPAPMPLLAVQSFANTLDVESGEDLLDSTETFQKWLEESELVKPGFKVRPDHLRQARELREALRDNLTAHSNGGSDPDSAQRMAKRAGTLHIGLVPDDAGRLSLDLSPVDSFADLGSQLMAIAFQAQIDGTWERLKLCENPECQWAFYDSSRNRSGSWCRMGLCGNRLKNRAYRERHRAS